MTYSLNDLLTGAKAMAHSYFGKKEEYVIKFDHEEDGGWYVDFPDWPFEHGNLLMVAGADRLCAFLSDDNLTTTVDVIPSANKLEKEGYAELNQVDASLTGGATYSVNGLEGFDSTIWLCPVTLFVLAQYPKYMYVRKHNNNDNRISATEVEEVKME